MFRAVLVFRAFQLCVSGFFRLCVSGCAWVVLGFCFGHGFRFWCADFLGFSFCSFSLVLMGTVGLCLCSDFMGFMVVVVVFWWLNEILFYCSIYIILLY